MSGSTRQDLCNCPKTVMEHEPGCPVVPFRLPDLASPRQGEPVDGLAAKASEYIEAVVTYLDPVNQFTHSRRRHVDRTGEELAELVAAALSEPAEAGEPA